MLSTIVEYKERGSYGNNNYRGNTTGMVVKDLLEFYKPRKVFDPMAGSGTTGDVCEELNIPCLQLDLNPKFGGWDALSDEIPESSDMIFFHPPYHDIIKYSSVYYPYDSRDLSQCTTYEDFISKLDAIQEKLIYSLRRGGRLVVLIGDIKKNGRLYSIQKDCNWYGSPEQIIIKKQFNTWSSRKTYRGKFIPIEHEYLLVFKRDDCYLIPHKIITGAAIDIRDNEEITWKDLVYATLEKLGGKSSLDCIYKEMQSFKRCSESKFWKEKVRQVLQICKDFKRIDKGLYAMAR